MRDIHELARTNRVLKDRPTVDLRAVKDVLNDFANERANASREQLERELGDLLLYLVRIAERLNVDLISAGQRQVERVAALSPVLVPKSFPKSDDPS